MARFNVGESVVPELRTYDNSSPGILANPSNDPIITITDPDGTVIVNEALMINEDVGIWTYTWLSVSTSVQGEYQVKYLVTNNNEISIQYDQFILGR